MARAAAHLALVGLALGLVLVGARHEPWFDEAQAWLIARDTPLVPMLAHVVRYEGTPGLWHALLRAAAVCGYPFGGLWLLSSALAWAGAAVVLYRAPFPVWLRVGIVFSYFFAYQYAIVARSYALDVLLVPALAALYGQKQRRPLSYCAVLGALANCNAHSFVFSGVLFLDFAAASREGGRLDRRMLGAGLLYGVLATAAALQAWPPHDGSFHVRTSPAAYAVRALLVLGEGFAERSDFLSLAAPSGGARLGGLILTGLILVPVGLLCRAAGKLTLFLGLMLALLAFSGVAYANAWHAGFLFLAYLFCLWVSWDGLAKLNEGQRLWLRAGVALLTAIQAWCTAAAWTREIAAPYSSGHAAALAVSTYQRAHPGARVGAMGFKAFSVQPWFARNAFANYNRGAAAPAYYQWVKGQTYPKGPDPDAWTALLAQGNEVLLLSSLDDGDQQDRYLARAGRSGYCLARTLEGGLIWKTYVSEPDDILFLTRCGHAGPAAIRLRPRVGLPEGTAG